MARSSGHPDDPPLGQTVSTARGFDGAWVHVRVDRVRLPSGRIATRETVEHPGAVAIVGITTDGMVLLLRQSHHTIGQTLLGLPAGTLEPGESPEACARRELEEETGYTAATWRFVCTIHNAIAYSDEHLELFLAEDLTAGEQKLDDGEFLETFAVTVLELLGMVQRGEITDVKTIIGAFWLEKILSGSWAPA